MLCPCFSPPFFSFLPEVFKQRPLRFLGGVHLDLGMVVVVVVVVVVVELVSLLLLLLLLLPLLLLEAVLARAEALPPTPSRCSPRWASSVHNAFSAGMFVGTSFELLLSPPLEAAGRSRGRDSRRAILAARLHAPFFTVEG